MRSRRKRPPASRFMGIVNFGRGGRRKSAVFAPRDAFGAAVGEDFVERERKIIQGAVNPSVAGIGTVVVVASGPAAVVVSVILHLVIGIVASGPAAAVVILHLIIGIVASGPAALVVGRGRGGARNDRIGAIDVDRIDAAFIQRLGIIGHTAASVRQNAGYQIAEIAVDMIGRAVGQHNVNGEGSVMVGGAAHGAVADLGFGIFALNGDIVEAGAVSADAVIIERAGSADTEVAGNVTDAAGYLGDIAGTVHHVDRDHAVGIVGYVPGEASALILCGSGLRCGLRCDSGRRLGSSLNVHIRRAGAGGLTGIVEGAEGAPAVHIPRDVGDAERRAVLAGHGGIEHAGKVLHGVLTAVRTDKGPGERVIDVGAGDKVRGSALLLVLIGRVLGDGEVNGLGVLRSGRNGRNRRGGGIVLQRRRLWYREHVRQLLLTLENGIAVRQTGDGSLVKNKPVEAGVALLGRGESVDAGGVVLLGGDGKTVGVRVRDVPDTVVDLGVLHGIGHVADDAVAHADRALDRVDVVVGEHDIVIEHIGPGIRVLVVIRIGTLRENVGEGFVGINVQASFRQRIHGVADFPDLQIGGAVCRVLRRGDQFQMTVMIEIGHGVIPLHLAGLLLFRNLGKEQTDLLVNRFCRGFGTGGRGEHAHGEYHHESEQSAEERFCLHSIYLQ